MVVVVVLTVCLTYVSVHIRPRDAPNWVAERLGASSRRPRHPFPALMAEEPPGRVSVYTALKKAPHGLTMTMMSCTALSTRTTEKKAQSLPIGCIRTPMSATRAEYQNHGETSAILAHEPYPNTNARKAR